MIEGKLRGAHIFLIVVCVSVFASCSKKPEDATKEIITNMIDTCNAGRNADAATQMDRATPAKQKQMMKKDRIDYSNPDDKKLVDDLCNDLKEKFKNGYEFGKFDTDGNALSWEVLPKGGNDGYMWAFELENGKYVIVAIAPTSR